MEKININRLDNKQILDNIIKIILKYLPNDDIEEIFLFGSRANNSNENFSDFDIGIKTNSSLPLSILQKIEDEIDELNTLKSFDIIDFSSVTNEFVEEVKKNKRILYAGKNYQPV